MVAFRAPGCKPEGFAGLLMGVPVDEEGRVPKPAPGQATNGAHFDEIACVTNHTEPEAKSRRRVESRSVSYMISCDQLNGFWAEQPNSIELAPAGKSTRAAYSEKSRRCRREWKRGWGYTRSNQASTLSLTEPRSRSLEA